MKNRAKCKLCKSVIESFLENDFVACQCGEISIKGGSQKFYCEALHWENFLRIDDQGNEIIVQVQDKNNQPLELTDLFEELDLMTSYHENMPDAVRLSFVNYYDFYSALLIIQNILKKMSEFKQKPHQL